MAQQTAVDWLIKELIIEMGYGSDLSRSDLKVLNEIIEEAKEMHKKEHAKTWDKSMENLDVRGGNIVRAWEDFDDYYNKTYKNISDE